jgi:NitT/TauT family transport system substrate-binding protein
MGDVLSLLQHGYDSRLVRITDVSHGGDVILVRPPMVALKELKGRRIGVEKTARGGYMLSHTLESVAMTLADVETVVVEVDDHERVHKEEIVDAVVTFEPTYSRLRASGANKLFDST